ncbi:DNA polymerase I [bacterium]|nr:DNA polymerase I [bacterium]
MSGNKRLLLIDGNAIIHRAYHALPPLTTKKGELVNAVYGFASTLLKVIDKFQPDYIAASFDLAGPTFRHKKFKDYKATRVKAPDELYEQIPKVKEVTKAFNIPIYEKKGFEADDVIGTLTHNSQLKTHNINIVIVTGDLDTLQLVNDKTKVYTMRRGISDSVLYDEKKVKERYGLKPEQLKDFKGLRGDPSDNIPGVKGVGEKTASSLLREYGTLENVYKNLDKIKKAVKEKLERDKMQAIMSKELGTIKTNVPIKLDLKSCATQDFNRQKIVNLFQELNFFSLIKRLPNGDVNDANIDANNADTRKGREGSNDGVKDLKYEVVSGVNLGEFIKELEKQKEIALAIECSHPNLLPEGEGADVKGAAFSWKTGRAYSVESKDNNLKKLKSILENKNIKKIGYDLKSVYKNLKERGIKPNGIYWDVMLAAYVLNPGSKIEFSKLVLEELGEELPEEKAGQLNLGIPGQESQSQKICQKADYSLKLKSILERKIEEISRKQKGIAGNLKTVFEKIEMPLVEVLAEIELAGVKVNPLILKGISEKMAARINNLEKSIYKLAGRKFNINSPSQLAEILFAILKLPTDDIRKIKTGFSTAAAELEKLRDKHEIIGKIESYRELFKLKTTYLDALPDMISEDFRIHTTFNQAVTATGRLSSENPNLQNIPKRTDIGKLVRTAFEAEEGFVFVSADYSQIDLRVMAHMSGDKKLIETFMAGEDVHRATAAEVNKITLSRVTEKMRSAAKALNFGIIYGMSAFGFAQAAKVSRDEAKEFISRYLEKFPQVAEFIKNTKELARKNGFVETETGRRRYLPEINSPNFQVAGAAERMAINMPIQGLAADIVKLAMIEAYRYITSDANLRTQKNAAKMVLQIHDEIILEVREDMAKEVSGKVKEIMENVYKLKVPLTVDVKIGDNWGEL